jgi:hypothetical protein
MPLDVTPCTLYSSYSPLKDDHSEELVGVNAVTVVRAVFSDEVEETRTQS